ncbi:anti-sigma factor [Aureimonas fodinaquatilis]|uniref:Anti-sigma factor n=1 Tax=Aureimonas fodinaquatilis TaxID=2565783 RepID=A0A5B0DZV8_9HYPH|nr:anti-sigma factor [Aureimonas fodinaquatilis]KAA0971908.1 anti-sigma factor [Aureimonas fodinaquatilis]
MSGAMTSDGMKDPEREGDDMIAAEYVLGVLPWDERQAIEKRISDDAVFANLVRNWESRFAPMNGAFEDVTPPASAKAALDQRLFGLGESSSAQRGGLLERLSFWRGLSIAAMIGLIALVAMPYLSPTLDKAPSERLVASLADPGSDVSYLVVYDSGLGEVSLSHVSGDRAADHDFELWVIEGDSAPVSLGVIPVGASVNVPVASGHRDLIGAGALFAISLEPEGGSPSGEPTGPVVAAGDLRTI